MIITLLDIIENFILDWFHCPSDPDPKRIKIFWNVFYWMICFSLGLGTLIMILLKFDEMKLLIMGVICMLISLILYYRCRKYTNNIKNINDSHDWWRGKGKWFHIIYKTRSFDN